jgi:Secretion system C-terminal sorting domain
MPHILYNTYYICISIHLFMKKYLLLFAALFITSITLFAQRNVAMYNANDAKTYYFNANTNYYIPFYVTDIGPTFCYKIKYSYRINNGTPVQEVAMVDHNKNWNCVNAPGLSKYRIALKTPLQFANNTTYTLTIWIDSLDGVADANHSNDTLRKNIKALANCPSRKGLIEYGYHVSCGPCGEDGTPFFDRAINEFSNEVVCVKLHNYSTSTPVAWAALNCPEARAIDSAFGSTAHPDFTFNRSSMEPFDNDDKFYPKYCPADSAYFIKDIIYNNFVPTEFRFKNYTLSASNKINFTLETKFLDAIAFTKEARLSVMLVEDSIWYYMYNNGVATIPDSIHHRYVLRKVYGNAFGEANTIPATVSANQVINFVVNDSVKSSWVKKNLYLIPTILNFGSNQNDHEILQAQLFSNTILSAPLSIGKNAMIEKLSVYPNPTNDKINIVCKNNICSICIYSLDGKIYKQQVVNSNNNKYEISLQNMLSGTYILKLQDVNGYLFTEKINIVR